MTSSKALISFPPRFLESVDSVAKWDCKSRSELIRDALRFYIKEHYGKDIVEFGLLNQ